MTELPAPPDYHPVDKAIGKTNDPEIAAALRLFASMPPSTGVLANPVRYHHTVTCRETPVELSIRSFGLRGCLLEEDIVTGSVEAMRVIFVGLFGRFPRHDERRAFSLLLSQVFTAAESRVLPTLAKFMKAFPNTPAHVAIQYWAAVRKATQDVGAVNPARPPEALLQDLIRIHLENVAAAATASYMRSLLKRRPGMSGRMLLRETKRFVESISRGDPFRAVFSLL